MVGTDDPAADRLVPLHGGHRGLEDRALVQIVVPANRARVFEDLRLVCELVVRDVAELLAERQVDVRLRIAGSARIAVPVPGAAEVATVLEDADIIEARLAQARGGQQAAETSADDENLDLVTHRRSIDRCLHVGIVDVMRQRTLDANVLVIAVCPQALVALDAVLLAKRIRIEFESVDIDAGGVDPGHSTYLWPSRLKRPRSRLCKRLSGRSGAYPQTPPSPSGRAKSR